MKIHVKGAQENNLKNIDTEFTAGITVVTGVSGSGKSSLVFDILYQESQRRFQEVFTIGRTGNARFSPAAVESISGLLPAVAVGQNLLNRNPNSSVATASGLHPLLRILYARYGVRHCPKCHASYHIIDSDSLINLIQQHESDCQVQLPLVSGVAGSHTTLLDLLQKSFGNTKLIVDGVSLKNTSLIAEKQHTISLILGDFEGDEHYTVIRGTIDKVFALGGSTVTLITPQNQQTYSLAPVCAECGTWIAPLEPKHFNQICPHCKGDGCTHCHGQGLHPLAAATTWQDMPFKQFLSHSIDQVQGEFYPDPLPDNAKRLSAEIKARLDALEQVGLGYVSLDRPVPTLSRGETQRLRLAVLLSGRIEDLLHLLDEPTIGQHPQDVEQLLESLAALSGPVIMVEHDRIAAAKAQAILDLGPGAGQQGGEIVFSGTPKGLWQADTITGRFFSHPECRIIPEKRAAPQAFVTIKNANCHNLNHLDVPLALNRLNVICGVSGSGKSTLVANILYETLHTGKPSGCEYIDSPKLKVAMVDQSPIGRNPRSNPATYTKLLDVIRELYASNTGLNPTSFSFNTAEGACSNCKGMGAIEIKMRYLPSRWIRCGECNGQRFSEDILAAKVPFLDRKSRSIAEFLDLTIKEAYQLIAQVPGISETMRLKAMPILRTMEEIGLGYLHLGQPSPSLSGGEAQRVKLTKYLGKRNLKNHILILDEPTTGLHPADIHGLLIILDRLVRAGSTVVVVEHNIDVIRAADWVIELGPGAGLQGGKLILAGPPSALESHQQTPTARALEDEKHLRVQPIKSAYQTSQPSLIKIKGARANNLKNVDLSIPKNALTVITGVSGSGKSSLVGDVIEREARRKYLESLAMYERQSVHEGPQADVDAIEGLGVTLAYSTQKSRYNQRAQLGEDTQITQALSVLFSHAGAMHCPTCNLAMMRKNENFVCPGCSKKTPLPKPRHFLPTTYAAACLTCHGVGTLQEPRPEKLIIHPEKPLCDGAMYSPGFFPNGYLCKPFNGGYDMVQAFAAKHDFDPAKTPWNQMHPETQQAFLYGEPEPMLVTFTSRKGVETTRKQRFPGVFGWIRDWDQGGTYTETVPCANCGGGGLREPYRSIQLSGRTMYGLRMMTLSNLLTYMENLPETITTDNFVEHALKKIHSRLLFLCKIGLGYLHLDRLSATLSAGEAQRVKLAGLLDGQLTGLTLLLDEPSRGLHPAEVDTLNAALLSLKQDNTLIVIEHDPQIIRSADFVVDMGPGAGEFGGRIVAQGTPEEIGTSECLTAQWLNGKQKFSIPPRRRKPTSWIKLVKPSGFNLKIDQLNVPLGVLVGVCGVSGSGKSVLIHDTLARILAPAKQTTSVAYEPIAPQPYQSLEGSPDHTLIISQTRAGLHNPASFLGIEKALRENFASSETAISLGLDAKSLRKSCSACKGSGYTRIEMGFLPDIFETCEVCGGSGYPPEANDIRIHNLTLPEVMSLSIDQAYKVFSGNKSLAPPLSVAMQVGLGYLKMGQPGRTLSGGEAQRLRIAYELNKRSKPRTLYILDEPTIGQHHHDVKRLVSVLQSLVETGHSVLVVEHHPHVLAACDWLIELGPKGGPKGGKIIAAGPPESIAEGNSPTACYLRQILEGRK